MHNTSFNVNNPASAPSSSNVFLPRVPWRRSPLLLLAYAAAIVLMTWPWLAHPATRVFDHWDPPFHAWKLVFAARTLLSGHLLPPYGNTNLYYPHSGAFFFEALHWPQAVFAAPLLALGVPEVTVYHVTLVFFWALSGVLFWAWLRALGLREPFASAGGLFFTVIPYRMSYAVEFNMQLCFGLVLLLFALVRYFQRPSVRYACLAALAWWLQATSELYQAVFALFVLPFWLFPLVARDPSILKSFRRFWLPLLSAAALAAVLSVPFLLPYAQTLGEGTLVRSLKEMRDHALDPFTYLIPYGRLRFFPVPNARPEEMSVFPTLSLAAVALFGLLSHLSGSGHRRPATLVFTIVYSLAAAALFLLHFVRGAGNLFAELSSWLLLAAVVAALPWLCRRNRSPARAAAAGLGAAALFGFVMSFGPRITDVAGNAGASNRLFLLHAATPALSGFRVISRFSVFPMLALCTAGAFGLQSAARAIPRRPRFLLPAAAVLFFAVFLAECIPAAPCGMRPVRDVSSSAAIAAFDALPDPAVLAIVPLGERMLDSEHMLTIERTDRLGVWAWGGTFPPFSKSLQHALDIFSVVDAPAAAVLLRQLWPDVYILEDRRPFPDIDPLDYAELFGPHAALVAEDPDFRLLRLLPDSTPSPEALRLIRTDFATERPHASFTLSAPAPARVWLDVNDVPIAAFDATPDPAAFTADIPSSVLLPHLPQRYRFHAESDAPFTLADFRLDPLPPDAAVAPLPPDPGLPWLATRAAIPPSAVPLDVRYPGGLRLCGVELLSTSPFPPEASGLALPSYRLRFWLRFSPRKKDNPPPFCLAPGYAQNGSVIYKYPSRLRNAINLPPFLFAANRLVPADVTLPVLSHLPSGTTYTLSFDLLTTSNRRLDARLPDGKKSRHLLLPLTVTIP